MHWCAVSFHGLTLAAFLSALVGSTWCNDAEERGALFCCWVGAYFTTELGHVMRVFHLFEKFRQVGFLGECVGFHGQSSGQMKYKAMNTTAPMMSPKMVWSVISGAP